MLHKEEQGLDTSVERDLILLVRQFYARNPKSATPKSVSHQACVLVDQLLASLSSPRVGSAATLFRQTATKMMTPMNGEHHGTTEGNGDFSTGYATAHLPQPHSLGFDSSSLPAFPSLNLHLTLSRSSFSLPASRVHSPEPPELALAVGAEQPNSVSNGEGGSSGSPENFDVTASRQALSSFAQVEVPGMGMGGMGGMQSTDWSEILKGMNDGSSVLVDGGW